MIAEFPSSARCFPWSCLKGVALSSIAVSMYSRWSLHGPAVLLGHAFEGVALEETFSVLVPGFCGQVVSGVL